MSGDLRPSAASSPVSVLVLCSRRRWGVGSGAAWLCLAAGRPWGAAAGEAVVAPSAEPARVPRTGTSQRPRPYFEKQLPREVIECHIFKGELEAAGAELCAQQAPTHTHHAGAVGFRAHRSARKGMLGQRTQRHALGLCPRRGQTGRCPLSVCRTPAPGLASPTVLGSDSAARAGPGVRSLRGVGRADPALQSAGSRSPAFGPTRGRAGAQGQTLLGAHVPADEGPNKPCPETEAVDMR